MSESEMFELNRDDEYDNEIDPFASEQEDEEEELSTGKEEEEKEEEKDEIENNPIHENDNNVLEDVKDELVEPNYIELEDENENDEVQEEYYIEHEDELEIEDENENENDSTLELDEIHVLEEENYQDEYSLDSNEEETLQTSQQEDCSKQCYIQVPFARVQVVMDIPEESLRIGDIFDFLRGQGYVEVFNADGVLNCTEGRIYWNENEAQQDWTEETELDLENGEGENEQRSFVLIHSLVKKGEEDCIEEGATLSRKTSKRTLMSRFKGLWSAPKSDVSGDVGMGKTDGLKEDSRATPCLFGRSLKDLKLIDGVPEFVVDVIEFLRRDELIQEGLFRLSGTFSRIQALQDRLDSGERLCDLGLGPTDCHNVTSLLKQFLRRLPEPLLTFELYDAWQGMGRWSGDSDVSVEMARFLISRLDGLNGRVLRVLLSFLNERLVDDVELTRMNACNYGTVIGPNLLWHPLEDRSKNVIGKASKSSTKPTSNTLGLSLQSSTLASQICTLFLQKYQEIFIVKPCSLAATIFAFGRVLYDYSCQGRKKLKEGDLVFITGIEDSLDGWWRGHVIRLGCAYEDDRDDNEKRSNEDNCEEENGELIDDEVSNDNDDSEVSDDESKFPSNYIRVLIQRENIF
jgi:hypothetical protein